jgi:hypothetical protein
MPASPARPPPEAIDPHRRHHVVAEEGQRSPSSASAHGASAAEGPHRPQCNGEAIKIKAKTAVRFKAGKQLEKKINK